ncbi:MAG: DUF2336 domain-containing protein [Pseudomonadota bacterium]|nr:DUF2336 domain-containing protein [Pseudomonadota bacterium]MDE3037443.1 DUF2336 domain-containing protein [Pseudomonadota bacterium]
MAATVKLAYRYDGVPMMNMTAMDVKRLTEEPSGEVRSVLAAKLATDYRDGHFTASEAAIAVDIFRILIQDTERRVRRALSEQLAHCPHVPRDVILKLASDEPDVAVHVLEYSSVLTEDDLISIVASTQEMMKLRAIARRDAVPEALSGRLLATRNESVLKDLFRNKGAALDANHLLQAWDAVAGNASLLEVLVQRGGLPLSVAEKMVAAVSDELKQHVIRQYKLSPMLVHKAAGDVREWEVLGVMPTQGEVIARDDEQVEDLVDGLHMNGRLTHSLLMRALCVGNVGMFEAGIAKLAGVPRVNARILLNDPGGLGFEAIYRAATMPEGFFEAVRMLLRISLEETDYGRQRRADFRQRIIDRIYMGNYHRTIENMQYLMSVIGGKILATANAH